jgi:hypothetical protein
MDEIVRNTEDVMLSNLDFRLNSTASYVQNRRASTFFCSGSNEYSPAGVRVMKIPISTENGWLDPETLRVQFTVNNKESGAAKFLRPLSGAWCFINRARLLIGSQICEDILEYNRCHEMFYQLSPENIKRNIDAENFGEVFDFNLGSLPDAIDSSDILAPNDYTDPRKQTDTKFAGIKNSGKRTVSFKPLFGLLNQPKWIPLKYAGGIVLELELVNTFGEPLMDAEVTVYDTFTPAKSSSNWAITNVQVKADIVELDSQTTEVFAQHLLRDNGSLDIQFNNFISQVQSLPIGATDVNINVQRTVSRLATVFVTLYRKLPDTAAAYSKFWNTFYNPLSKADGIRQDDGDEMQFSLNIAGKVIPEYPINSQSEFFTELQKAVGLYSSNFHSIGIRPNGLGSYSDSRFIIGINCEKALGATFTGIENKSGGLTHIKLRANDSARPVFAGGIADTMHIVMVNDQVVKIRATGVEIRD